jgi:hypothetical protein
MPLLDEELWAELLRRISNEEVIPVVGPGAVTFGPDNELLYPWLAQRLPNDLDPPLTLSMPPRDLQEVVDAQRAQGQPVDRIYKRLYRLVKEPDLRPGASLTLLAGIEGFKLFISTTFDPLLWRAVESASPGGRLEERQGAATLRGPCPDLPREFARIEYPFVYQILGQAEPVRDFVVWDDDLLHFLLRLNHQLPTLPRLSDALQRNHLLVLGLSFADWLLRFFVQVVKQQRLSELASTDLFVFEQLAPADRDKVVVYFSRLTKQIRILPIDPIEFIDQLHTRWRQKHGSAVVAPFDATRAHREKHRTRCCIFVSYASADLEIAHHVVRQLQAAGCLVWFDKEQIQPGERWEEVLREAVEDRCGLFVSIISDHTAERLEGYTILERNLAARRRDRFAESAVFYLPVRIDAGEPMIPSNEPRAMRQVHGVRKIGGHLDPEFIGYVRQKQRENCTALGVQAPLS